MKKNSGFYFLIIFLSGLLLIFIVAPMVGMVLSSSTSKIFDTAQDPQFRESLRLTLLTSAAATLVGAIGAIPLAWLLARHEFF